MKKGLCFFLLIVLCFICLSGCKKPPEKYYKPQSSTSTEPSDSSPATEPEGSPGEGENQTPVIVTPLIPF